MADELIVFLRKQGYSPDTFALDIIDIDESAELQSQYAGRIPVLVFADSVLCEYFFNEENTQAILSP